MTSDQIIIVQSTWNQLQPMGPTVARLFYSRLFELDPRLRRLFQSDLEQQGQRLVAMIDVAVGALDQFDTVTPTVRALGERHIRYGVQAHDYDTVGEALLWTLSQGLGNAFTEEAREAWLAVYTALAGEMQHAKQVAAA